MEPDSFQTSPPPKAQGGCFTTVLILIGLAMAGFSLLGFIVGLFGYRLKVSGSPLPHIDLEVLIPCLVLSAFFIGLGFGIEFVQKKIKRRKD